MNYLKMKRQDNHVFFWENHKIVLTLFFLLGLVLRIYNLGTHNLWFDEFVSFAITRLVGLRGVFYDYQPPLYYSLLYLWVKCFGSSEFALRFLSMLFGVVSIILIYKLGKLLFDKKVALISAFMLSISPMHIWYAQEARGYTLSAFLVILIVYFLYLVLKTNRLNYWLALILTSLIGIYTNYFIFFIIIVAILLLFQNRYRYLLKRWLIGCFFIFISFLFWLPVFLRQISSVQEGFWITKPNLKSVLITFHNFNAGYNATLNIYFLLFIIFSLLFILGIIYCWKTKSQELLFLILLIIIPIITTFLISQKMSVYLNRQLMLFSPFYYIILAAGLAKVKVRILQIGIYAAMLSLISICLYNYFSYRMPSGYLYHIKSSVKKPVKPAADYIRVNREEKDMVCVSSNSISSIFYYLTPDIQKLKRQLWNRQFGFLITNSYQVKLEPFWWQMTKNRLRSGIPLSLIQLVRGKSDIPGIKTLEEYDFKRIWLVSSSWERDGEIGLTAESIRQWMRQNYLLKDYKELDGIFVELFEKREE